MAVLYSAPYGDCDNFKLVWVPMPHPGNYRHSLSRLWNDPGGSLYAEARFCGSLGTALLGVSATGPVSLAGRQLCGGPIDRVPPNCSGYCICLSGNYLVVCTALEDFSDLAKWCIKIDWTFTLFLSDIFESKLLYLVK